MSIFPTVVVLNEVDWGLKRTNYRNVARDLALAMHMNYAYRLGRSKPLRKPEIAT